MSRRGKGGKTHFDEFNPHTRLKHSLLETYLAKWASILLNKNSRGWFVDAFAGEGKDDQGNPGSPLIACTVAKRIRLSFLARGKAREIKVVAIEASKARVKALRQTLAEFTRVGAAEVIHGRAWDALEKVLAESRGEPLIAFLDPFGVKGLSATNLAKLLAVPKREALILFNDLGANRLHASGTSKPTVKPHFNPDLFFTEEEHFQIEADEPEQTEEQVLAWQLKNIDILNDAFGKGWPAVEREVNAAPSNQRRLMLASAYIRCLKSESGALYVTPMSITDEKGKHHYYLVHAANNASARVAMKRAMHTAFAAHDRATNTMFPGMSYQSPADLDTAAAMIVRYFAGRTELVRWTGGEDEKDTVHYYFLAETDALEVDKESLRERLEPYRVTKKPAAYRFPPIT